ncbi:transposase [Streptomyces sp. NPDC056454]|uniref:transposase n=1 Tax=Streptomyces sp. NPDC056454 TaxID=3345823 RepID=UPI0036A8B6F0
MRSRRGRRRLKPGKLQPTRGTATPTCGSGHANAASPTASPARSRILATAGPHRWTVERSMAWLAGCRRLHRCCERRADRFLAFTGIARALIRYRGLAE